MAVKDIVFGNSKPPMLRARFHVCVGLYYYYPTPKGMRKRTGREGTHILNKAPIILFKDPDYVDLDVGEAMRKQWLYGLKDAQMRSQHAQVPLSWVRNAKSPIPTDFSVNLPVHRRFASDPVYGDVYRRESNGATFEDVVRSLIPFNGVRQMVQNVQAELVVPLYRVRLMSMRASAMN